MSGLLGRRVLVTRPRDQAASLVAGLEASGAVPVVMPLITIARPRDPGPARDAIRRLGSYDWVVCTSANGARALAARLRDEELDWPSGPRLAAIGPRTAQAARDEGLPVHAQPAEFRGRAVPAALGNVRDRFVLLPRSDIGREETPEALRSAGAIVDDVVFYRTVSATPEPEALAELATGVDILTFTSPSTVTAFATLGAIAEALAATATIACIGPVTADAARSIGWTVHVQPAEYTAEALLEALRGIS
jgi:uroporphyrinogen III methyltransferase/synthase